MLIPYSFVNVSLTALSLSYADLSLLNKYMKEILSIREIVARSQTLTPKLSFFVMSVKCDYCW